MDLIETLWNVKRKELGSVWRDGRDLIETLWNVKLAKKPDEVGGYRDLIETLWNVKYCVVQYMLPLNKRFNRDIVECKV